MEVNTLSAPSASESRIQVWSGSSLDLVCLPAPWCVCSIFLCLHVYTSDPDFRELDQLPDEHLIQVQSSYKHLIHVFSIIHHKFRFPEFQNAAAFKEIQDGEQRSSSPEWHWGTQSRYYYYSISTTHDSICAVVDVIIDILYIFNWTELVFSHFSFPGETPMTSVTSPLKPCSVSVSPLVIPAGTKQQSTTADSASRWAGPITCPLALVEHVIMSRTGDLWDRRVRQSCHCHGQRPCCVSRRPTCVLLAVLVLKWCLLRSIDGTSLSWGSTIDKQKPGLKSKVQPVSCYLNTLCRQ